MKRITRKAYLFYILSLCFGILALVGVFIQNQDKMTMECLKGISYGNCGFWKFKTNTKTKLIRYTVYQLENGKWEKVGEEQKKLGKMKSGVLRVVFDPFQQDNVDVAILQGINSDKIIEIPSIFTKSKYKKSEKFWRIGNRALDKRKIENNKEIPIIVKLVAKGKWTDMSDANFDNPEDRNTMGIEAAKIYIPDISFEHPEYYNDKQYKEAFLMTICFE